MDIGALLENEGVDVARGACIKPVRTSFGYNSVVAYRESFRGPRTKDHEAKRWYYQYHASLLHVYILLTECVAALDRRMASLSEAERFSTRPRPAGMPRVKYSVLVQLDQ